MRPTSLAHLIPAGTARSRLLRNRLNSDFEASREPLLRLAAGDIAPFLELAKNDPGFPFEPDAISALNQLVRNRRADFEGLRSGLKAERRVRLSALEAAMKAQAVGGGDDAVNRSGQPIEYDEIDQWDEPVEGAELLAGLARAIDDDVIMDAHQRDAVALWIVYAHAHDFSVFAPLLVILSPTKRCGKTRLQEVLARLAPRPQTMSGVSATALARLIEEHRPTIFIDEFDAVAKSSGEMAESLRGLFELVVQQKRRLRLEDRTASRRRLGGEEILDLGSDVRRGNRPGSRYRRGPQRRHPAGAEAAHADRQAFARQGRRRIARARAQDRTLRRRHRTAVAA